MKKKSDPRHLRRTKLIQKLFTFSFSKDDKIPQDIKPIISHLSKIDKLIEQSAPDRPISQINRIDLAILRLATFELIIKKDAPLKVVVDEAIELGKEFGSDSSQSFINGALGQLIKLNNIKV